VYLTGLLFALTFLPPAACPVTVVAQGVRGSEGTVGFVVFKSKAGWPEKSDEAFRSQGIKAKPGDMAAVFDLPAGRYAIAVLHDENGNKHLDRKPSGRPREGYGISNNPKVLLKAPGFEAAAVDMTCGARVLVRLRYPGPDGTGSQSKDGK
jgi:uncharacterized protein (DUF2141 family)